MSNPETSTETAVEDREEWFLSQLESEQIQVDELLSFLSECRARGDTEQAATWTDLLFDTLIEQGAFKESINVLAQRTGWENGSEGVLQRCRTDAVRAMEKSRERRVLVDESGFDKECPPTECMRRLSMLLDLDPGKLCYDKTWGFGVVRHVDYFYKRVEIDFEKKSDHHMSLAYAAEALDLIGEDHILARKHDQPGEVARMVREEPGAVVRISLRSYGPLTVPALQEKLVPAIIEEEGWKRFWDAARKELKKDALVDIPGKRSQPIRLLKKARSFDEEWFGKLGKKRNLKNIIALMEEVLEQPNSQELVQEHEKVILNRLAFVVKGAHPRWPGLIAQALMVARRMGLPGEPLQAESHIREFLQSACVQETVRQLPARSVRPFLEFLLLHDREGTLDLLLSLLPKMEIGMLGDSMDVLLQEGREQACANTFRHLFDRMAPGVEIVTWVLRNPARLEAWRLGSLQDLASAALDQVEEDYSGERLRAQNQVREFFAREEWFYSALDSMNEDKRRAFADRLKDCSGFPAMDRRSLMGKAIKRYPELQEVMSGRPRDASKQRKLGRVTSNRSYRQRQAQLEKIVNVDIPENSKEIGIARSYGDLRENHEFKAAKEMQGILMHRQGELEKMLSEVKPTDFRNLPSERVGMATGVELAYPDGTREKYFILGEWDRSEELHIISCTTRMAQALDGRAAGDEVIVPTEHGESTCTIAAVTGLPDPVLQWIEEEPTA